MEKKIVPVELLNVMFDMIGNSIQSKYTTNQVMQINAEINKCAEFIESEDDKDAGKDEK